MWQKLKILRRFWQFYWRAKTRFTVHSPFVFAFVEHVLEDSRVFYAFREVEHLRTELLSSQESVEIEDFGAGSHVHGRIRQRRVADIAGTSLSESFQCRWLFRVCTLYKPLTVIELGTSLGVSTLYLTEGSPRAAQIFTLEGAPNIAQLARNNFAWFYDTFRHWGLRFTDENTLNIDRYRPFLSTDFDKNRIQIVVGNFDQTLPQTLQSLDKLDLAFIDGNHRYEPTMRYFEACLSKVHEHSVLIFDDVHWSEEMERAWHDVKNHPSVKLSLDLFWCGVVFFRNENREKEHFELVKSAWKPLSMGFWH